MKNLWMRIVAVLMTAVMILSSGQMVWSMSADEYCGMDYSWFESDCFVGALRWLRDFEVTGSDSCSLEVQIQWEHFT